MFTHIQFCQFMILLDDNFACRPDYFVNSAYPSDRSSVNGQYSRGMFFSFILHNLHIYLMLPIIYPCPYDLIIRGQAFSCILRIDSFCSKISSIFYSTSILYTFVTRNHKSVTTIVSCLRRS